MAQHPVEVSREALLKSVSSKRRKLLVAGIQEIHSQRFEEQKAAEKAALETSGQARSLMVTVPYMEDVWAGLLSSGKSAAQAFISAGLKAGAKDDLISNFVAEDLKHHLVAQTANHVVEIAKSWGHTNALKFPGIAKLFPKAASPTAGQLRKSAKRPRALRTGST